jgi:ribosomal protein S15P/S13E
MERLRGMEKIKLSNYLEILTRRAFADLFTAEKGIDRKEFIEDLHGAIENTGDYFDEGKIIEEIENSINEKIQDENLRSEFLKTIIETDEDGNKRLNEKWRSSLEDYFRKSPEKKGINFRDQIKDSNELRAWLYLTIKDENIKNQFRPDFERTLSQREIIYFRLWPPTIVNGLKYLILGEAKPKGFKEGEFVKELQSYIEDLQKGKNRITFWFEENVLPEELRNKNEEELRNLGIEKRDNVYEFYITPDQISDFILNFVTVYTESIKEQTELTKLFQETKNLLKEVRAKVPSELKQLVGMYGSLLFGLEENYRNMLEAGASNEEIDKIKKSVEEIKKHLEEIKKDIEAKKPALDIKSKVGKWLKDKGPLIIGGIGLWALAIGWFLPLWIISKMYDQIEKGPLMKR